MDLCYRDFSYFSAPRAHAMASRPEIAGSARNPADESRPHIRSRAVALRAAPRGDCRRVFLLLPRNLRRMRPMAEPTAATAPRGGRSPPRSKQRLRFAARRAEEPKG